MSGAFYFHIQSYICIIYQKWDTERCDTKYPIQKSQPNFPNPEETYPEVGSNNKAHTHCYAIF